MFIHYPAHLVGFVELRPEIMKIDGEALLPEVAGDLHRILEGLAGNEPPTSLHYPRAVLEKILQIPVSGQIQKCLSKNHGDPAAPKLPATLLSILKASHRPRQAADRKS
ncbi:hypothetical protein DESUT3_18470 [Desulfuromonas versatilis]|uniref:Uncharacterized protein n=1 Tax=Desulfuromonas versatilis TaxID=2802975 RepID=A0ABM8HW71_9BACT|nr:hypothetical protein DESUT3_18470 [Desulfuromonas versatilis]